MAWLFYGHLFYGVAYCGVSSSGGNLLYLTTWHFATISDAIYIVGIYTNPHSISRYSSYDRVSRAGINYIGMDNTSLSTNIDNAYKFAT